MEVLRERAVTTTTLVRLGILCSGMLLYWLICPLGFCLFALIHLFGPRDREGQRRRAQRAQTLLRHVFIRVHDLLRWAGLIGFDPRAPLGELPAAPAVLVANHPGLFDVTALMATIPGVTAAVKPSLFRSSAWRPLLRDARMFEGAGDRYDCADVIDAAVERLREGYYVLIFPEGMRSPPGSLRRFGRTAFEIACRAQVPVVPIVTHYDPVWLGKGQPLLPLPQRTPWLRFSALPAVQPADHGFSSRKLRAVVEALLRCRLELTRPASHVNTYERSTDGSGTPSGSAVAEQSRVAS